MPTTATPSDNQSKTLPRRTAAIVPSATPNTTANVSPKRPMVTDTVARTATAKAYTAGKRLYGYVEGDLLYAYDMAAMGQEIQPHTWAQLQRGAGT